MIIRPFEFGSKGHLNYAPVEYGTEIGEMSARAGNGFNDFDPNNPNARGEGIDEQDISQEITKLRPDEYPLDTIMRNLSAKSSNVQSPEVKYYQQSSKPFADALDATATGTGATQASPKGDAYSATGNGLTSMFIQVMNGEIFRTKDTILIENCTVVTTADGKKQLGATGGKTITDYAQLFHVLSKSGNVLEVQPIGGMLGNGANASKFVVPSFGAGATIYRCGSAHGEKDMQTEPFGIIPDAQTNFCQKFMAQVEETTWQKLWKKEISYDMSDMEADALFEFRGEIEAAYLFGEKYFKDDARSGRTYFCEGLVRTLEGQEPLEYGTGGTDRSLTPAMWMGWLQKLFTGNNGSKTRVMFAGSGLISAIELFQLSSSQKQMQINAVQDTYLGVKVTKIYNTFGELNIIRHPLFDEMGAWTDCGLVLDPQFLYKHTFESMTATNLDFKSSGQKDVDAKVLKETSCVTLRYPSCHAIIKPKA